MVAPVFLQLGAALTAAVLAFAFVLGAVFASFIACVAGRLEEGETPWSGRSRCDSCGHVLGPLDLVPVASWLIAGGRCRYCKERIPVRCVATEVLLGVVFACLVLRFGLTVDAAAYCALAVLLLGLSLVDLDSMIIPNGFLAAGMAVWVLQVVAHAVLQATGAADAAALLGEAPAILQAGLFAHMGAPLALVADGLLGAFAVAGGILAFSLVLDRFLGRQSLGGGDVKLLFVAGLFLGLPLGLLNLMLSCVVGLGFALLGGSSGKAFPFGPAISLSVVLTLMVGAQAVGWYLGLLA